MRTVRKYAISEIFRSIQGEGYHAGRPAVFVRFSGCNLKCDFCDTDHTQKEELTFQELQERLDSLLRCGDILVLTGGEPTLQNLSPIISFCSVTQVCIETNGTRERTLCDLRAKHANAWITVSPKYKHVRYDSFLHAHEVKVVYDERLDFDKIWRSMDSSLCHAHKGYIQPCSENIQPALDFVLKHPWWRLSLQLQKIINVR